MIVVIGLIILVAAVIVGVAGVFANGGSTHAVTDNFAVFGYHVTGPTGVLFLYGIVVGGVGIVGLSMLLAGARRTAHRAKVARRELAGSRQIPTSGRPDRDYADQAPSAADHKLVARPDDTPVARTETSGDVAERKDGQPAPRLLGHLFGRRSAAHDTTATPTPHGNYR
jgi:hypothetical protein